METFNLAAWKEYALDAPFLEHLDDLLLMRKHENRKVQKEKNHKVLTTSQMFTPTQTDSLFWCFYIFKHGFANYGASTLAHSFEEEKKLKYAYIQKVRDEKAFLKANKILIGRDGIENDLANETCIGLKTFVALCLIEKLNVLILHKKKCFDLMCDSKIVSGTEVVDTDDEEEDGCGGEGEGEGGSGGGGGRMQVVHIFDNPTRNTIQTNVSKEMIANYRHSYFPWTQIDKPLKSIFSYKTEELRRIADDMNLFEEIKVHTKETKQSLYDLIANAIH